MLVTGRQRRPKSPQKCRLGRVLGLSGTGVRATTDDRWSGPMNDTQGANSEVITAAILVIGDEILSGRTKDKNIGYIAEYLTNIGIDMREVRVVPDIEHEIIAALDALRHRY